MEIGVQEKFMQCPYCFESISMLIESLYPGQTYIEDCEVCCRPIKISVSSQEDGIEVQAERVD